MSFGEIVPWFVDGTLGERDRHGLLKEEILSLLVYKGQPSQEKPP